jgi:hypothetical protein
MAAAFYSPESFHIGIEKDNKPQQVGTWGRRVVTLVASFPERVLASAWVDDVADLFRPGLTRAEADNILQEAEERRRARELAKIEADKIIEGHTDGQEETV